jgi:threonine dehydrogenase-like Zn-dependent dehydrogenase
LAGEIKGKNILVSGTGMLGITACAMCRTNGAKNIFAVDIDEERKKNAKLFGADKTVTPVEMEKLEASAPGSSKIFDVVLEFSGIPATMEQTLDYLVIGGIAVWIGATFPARSTRVDAEKIVRNLITIKGLHNYNEDDLVEAVNFMENYHNNFPFLSLVHNQFTLDEVNEAFHYALTENPFRAGIQID